MCLISRLSWEDARDNCEATGKRLFKYHNEDSLQALYIDARRNLAQHGWHGLGDIVFVGAKINISLSNILKCTSLFFTLSKLSGH